MASRTILGHVNGSNTLHQHITGTLYRRNYVSLRTNRRLFLNTHPVPRLSTSSRASSLQSKSRQISSSSRVHCASLQTDPSVDTTESSKSTSRSLPTSGPSLEDFLRQSIVSSSENDASNAKSRGPSDMSFPASSAHDLFPGGTRSRPVVKNSPSKNFYIETYGCQMNVSDTEIVHSVMKNAGYNHTKDITNADVILANTCAIRENAEQKVWGRLGYFKGIKRSKSKKDAKPVVGVLGCMAERLKKKLLESDRSVDIVAGPDAYRDLPNLIHMVTSGSEEAAINVQLSQDETYADISPVRPASNAVHAFVSIMRGCNNMCTYCIVPFTRGRERSRQVSSIEDEVRQLVDQGYKEVVLLGQNVNSYYDKNTMTHGIGSYASFGYQTADGFNNLYSAKSRDGNGVRFTELLERITRLAPEMRVRFTSPHPKDFPDPLLQLMRERPNLCNQIHMPAQSGSSAVLERMRRLYTREAYLELADKIRSTVPGVALSSDFISGFCGETEQDHLDTLSLMEIVKYEQAFMFAYSLRERTKAAYKLIDDVPEDVKLRRLQEIIDTFNRNATKQNEKEVGKRHVVLVEGPSKRSTDVNPTFTGRTDNNKRVVFDSTHVAETYSEFRTQEDILLASTGSLLASTGSLLASTGSLEQDTCNVEKELNRNNEILSRTNTLIPQKGDYIVVHISEAGLKTLKGQPLAKTTIKEAHQHLTDVLCM